MIKVTDWKAYATEQAALHRQAETALLSEIERLQSLVKFHEEQNHQAEAMRESGHASDLSQTVSRVGCEGMSGFLTEHIKECCVCLAPVDTREETEGGNPDGCQIDGGKWVCSSECWDDAVESKEDQ